MQNNNSRFVAHIDILGMKQLMNKDPEKAWQVLSGLSSQTCEIHFGAGSQSGVDGEQRVVMLD